MPMSRVYAVWVHCPDFKWWPNLNISIFMYVLEMLYVHFGHIFEDKGTEDTRQVSVKGLSFQPIIWLTPEIKSC